MVQTIAIQCPYLGGNTVYRARVLLALITDTLTYDDATNCLQVGIFRSASEQIQPETDTDITIIPNPASDEIEIVIEKGIKENCTIEIIDALGRVSLKRNLKCNVAAQKLSIDVLQEGYYTVKISSQNELICRKKLLVIK